MVFCVLLTEATSVLLSDNSGGLTVVRLDLEGSVALDIPEALLLSRVLFRESLL